MIANIPLLHHLKSYQAQKCVSWAALCSPWHILSFIIPREKKSLSNLCYLVGKTLVESSPWLVPYHLITLSLTCLTELNRCSVDDSGAITWMEYAKLSTRPGQTGPSVSLERQVAPQSVILSWGSRNGQNVGCRLSHCCSECKLMQCVLTCVVFWGGTGSTLLLKIVKTHVIV